MTLIQAILLGGCYWMYVNEIGSGFNYAFFCYPSTACLWYGLILGDVKTALLCGGTIAPLFLGYAAVGAMVATDKAAATIIPTAAVICYGMDLNVALALSVPVGLLFAQMHTLRRTIGSWYIRRAERIIEDDCDSKKLYFNGIVIPSLVKAILFWLPMTLICYFALQSFSGFMDRIPPWLQAGLGAIGGALPALGMGLLLNGMGEKKLLPFFFAGYFLAHYTGLDNIALVLIALFVAWLYMNSTKGSVESEFEEDDEETEEVRIQNVLSKSDVTKAYLRWMAFNEVPSSYERHMGYGILMSYLPCLKKLYKGRPDELKDACRRHLSYFNTEQFWGACVPGAALAMEEQKALGAPISGTDIESVKVGLMGPLAGIGDTINWVTIVPLLLAFFVPYCVQGNIWAPIIPMLLIFAMVNIEGLLLFPFGYKLGTRAAASILSSGKLKTFFKFTGVLGMFMIGALSASLVHVTTPIEIVADGRVQSLQAVFDSIIPGALSLLVIVFVYGFLEKKGRRSVNLCMLCLLIGALLLGCLGIIA